jgi:type I restriction enzyme M protein
LAGKKILFTTIKEWSKIDLTPFSNSDITSLEEHIKFKWADISADTAGEQYTPKDVIQLMSDIVVERIDFPKSEFITVYDPTCGGGNLLFGVADDLDRTHGYNVKTYGQDWNDTLYALAWIESRFRKDAVVEYGNTLTDTKIYQDQKFKVIVANPPHGIAWKGYSAEIYKDETQRFQHLPSTSDGQLLFAQHILHHLDDKGIATVVHNGSALFSGDAGSGESDIRKLFFDNDWVEAIIQLPTDEFFNTGIHTYIWLFNKNKSEERQNKVMLLDASDLFKPLKKSFGKKRKEVNEENRQKIVAALRDFKDNDFAKIFDKDYFYFNKQAVRLTNLDENGLSLEKHLPTKTDKKTGEVKSLKDIKINDLESITFENTTWTTADLSRENATPEDYEAVKEFLKNADYKTQTITLHAKNTAFHFDNEKSTIVKTVKGKASELGNGKVLIKASYKKKTKTKPSLLTIKASLEPNYDKDYEVIPFSRNTEQNDGLINDFLKKYIFKPHIQLDSKVGVEINFNKVFYQPEPLRPIDDILSDIAGLDAELAALEAELNL